MDSQVDVGDVLDFCDEQPAFTTSFWAARRGLSRQKSIGVTLGNLHKCSWYVDAEAWLGGHLDLHGKPCVP